MRRSALVVPLLPLALMASACGAGPDETPEESAATPAVDASWEERTGSHGAVLPRLLLSDAGSGAVTVLDVNTGATAGTVEATGPARFATVTTDGGLAFLVQGDDDTVQLLDAGIRYEAHGEHSDPKHVEPAIVEGSIDVPTPSHVVTHDDHAAIFADGDAGVSLVHLDGEEAPAKLAAEAKVEAGDPHHGVSVPLGHDLVTSLGDADGERVGVQVLTEDGTVEETFEECPGLHGEFTPDDDTVLFGCADGVLKVHNDGGKWATTKIANPDDTEDAKVGTIRGRAGEEVVLGNYSDGAVVLIDTHDDSMTRVEVPGTVASIAWDPYWGTGLVLTTDGTLHTVDPESKELGASVQATDEFRTDSEDGGRAVVVAGENYVYLVNPTTRELVEVAVSGEGLAVERNKVLDFVPRDLAVVGLAALESPGHDDGHEEEHDHAEDEGHSHDDGHDHDH
ncbi:hypothetical protein [Nocardiopsis ansamitocini]|uniref:Secreted protein n=1 Tax=Nocardiopsis ansamitocini TaxID=1670832 RepID=A0A9W6P8S4_9ACTN|nr:hypothetical protein [Nocardiopsis ansamitocini]GLU49690.1 hypothetical protein Nans01_40410 [Nocardiopsis ansamitocini]